MSSHSAVPLLTFGLEKDVTKIGILFQSTSVFWKESDDFYLF